MVLLKQNEQLKCVMENKGSVAKMIKMRGRNSMLTSKLQFVKYLGSMLMDFHKTSITGILLMRQSKSGAPTLCYLQNCTFC